MWYHWGLPVESRTSLGWSSVCLDFLLSHLQEDLQLLAAVVEDVSPSLGQAKAVDGQIVNWDTSQGESTAPPCVPGVRVQRQTHDEEANHCEGDCNGQWHLERSWVEGEAISMDEHPQGCQGDEEPACEGGKVDELVDFSGD